MNKLSLDQIGFIKHKLQQFMVIPSSPVKEQPPPDNLDNSKFFISPNKSKTLEISIKNHSITIQSPNENKKWLAKKQNDIFQFITYENRSRDSLLNKFLNSDKIHLKKREEVDKQFQSKQAQITKENQKEESQNFSFDEGSPSQKKVHKNNENIIDNKDGLLQSDNSGNKNIKQSQDNSQLQLINILKDMKEKPQTKLHQQQNKKPIFVVETQNCLVKPSALRGKLFEIKNQQVQTPKMNNNIFVNQKRTIFNFENSVTKTNQVKKKGNQKTNLLIEKSDSEVSLKKKKKSSSFTNIKDCNEQNKLRKKSISKNDRNLIKNISGSPSKNSFDFFDSQRPSTIKPPPTLQYPNIHSRRQSIQLQSPAKSQTAMSPNRFPSSVYKKSFKNSPYELTSQQKFYINKYRLKQLSPEDRKNLKQKYELLDKRLVKILQSVKVQKDEKEPGTTHSFSSSQIREKQLPHRKAQIPQQIMFYKKFSPLKKVLKINKQLRMKFNPDDI